MQAMEVEEKSDVVVKDSSGFVGECIGGEIGTDRLSRIGQRHAFMAVRVMIRKASLDKQLMVHTWPRRFAFSTPEFPMIMTLTVRMNKRRQ